QPTPHPQVVRVQDRRWPLSPSELDGTVDELLGAAADGDRDEVRGLLWLLARDGAAPPALTSRAQASGGSSALGSGGSLGWGGGTGVATMTLAQPGPARPGPGR